MNDEDITTVGDTSATLTTTGPVLDPAPLAPVGTGAVPAPSMLKTIAPSLLTALPLAEDGSRPPYVLPEHQSEPAVLEQTDLVGDTAEHLYSIYVTAHEGLPQPVYARLSPKEQVAWRAVAAETLEIGDEKL